MKKCSIVRYHGPYVDASGECFYLPKKWRRGERDNDWRECNVDYAFKKDEMNGTDLIRNLRWLGRSNQVIKLANDDSEEVENDIEEDDSDVGSELVGRGLQQFGKRKRKPCDTLDDERIIRRAMPEMDNTLSNWTLHRQNLGKMLRNYKRQYRDLPPNHRRELGHFFNTTSAVLDTNGSMTENSILRSVQLDKKPSSLMGGGHDNAPQPKLPPTDINLSRYVAFFPDYQLDNGHVLEPNPTFGSAIFSSSYPPYHDAHKLRQNPAMPVVDKEYSADDNSSMDESVDFLQTKETTITVLKCVNSTLGTKLFVYMNEN